MDSALRTASTVIMTERWFSRSIVFSVRLGFMLRRGMFRAALSASLPAPSATSSADDPAPRFLSVVSYRLGLGFGYVEIFDDYQAALLRLAGQRANERAAPHTLGGAVAVAPGARAEGNAAAAPYGGSDGSRAGASGVLLWSGLGAAARHLAARLGLGGSLPAIGEMTDHDLVHERDVRLDAENVVSYGDGAGDLACQILYF